MEHERIIIDSQVMDGEPVIGGSNVTVASFVETLASALAHAAIREVYPQLSPEDVQAAFAFVQEAVTARRQFAAQQEHLAAERERALAMMRAVVESTADGVLVVSNDNRVMICNQRFESMWKLRPGWYEAQYPEWLYLLARQTQDPVGFIQRVETLNDHPDAEGYDIIELKGDQVFERYATPYAVGGEIVGRVWSFRDVTDRKRADVELRASRARLKAIFDNVAVGIGLVDTEGRYIQTNEQWDLMLNRRRPEDPGTVELDIADQTENPVISRKQLKALIRGEIDAFHTEKRIVREDGSVFWGDLSISPIRAPDGSLEAIIGMIVDITERKKSEAEREQLIVELDAFAHTVAHDLQNPLSIVMGYVELLRLDFKIMPDEDIREFLNTIARNSLRMNNIIDELLVLSSVRKLDEVAVGPLDMAQIIAEARERLMLMIEETGAEITFDKPPGEWPVALGYAPWIEEVWANYLSNAIKYGAPTPCPDSDEQPPVPPQIELGAKWDPVQDKVRFWVRDHGPGITPEDQQKLFVQFTRLNGTRAAGHGLGLSIVQRIVARLGGEVGIESAPGVGSTFYFTLPCKN